MAVASTTTLPMTSHPQRYRPILNIKKKGPILFQLHQPCLQAVWFLGSKSHSERTVMVNKLDAQRTSKNDPPPYDPTILLKHHWPLYKCQWWRCIWGEVEVVMVVMVPSKQAACQSMVMVEATTMDDTRHRANTPLTASIKCPTHLQQVCHSLTIQQLWGIALLTYTQQSIRSRNNKQIFRTRRSSYGW